jgi:hypothetical protein
VQACANSGALSPRALTAVLAFQLPLYIRGGPPDPRSTDHVVHVDHSTRYATVSTTTTESNAERLVHSARSPAEASQRLSGLLANKGFRRNICFARSLPTHILLVSRLRPRRRRLDSPSQSSIEPSTRDKKSSRVLRPLPRIRGWRRHYSGRASRCHDPAARGRARRQAQEVS